jgi:predicted ester cyclase
MHPNSASVVTNFAEAACSGDGRRLARCFTEDGVYHDGFYGAFVGAEQIRVFLEERVMRDSTDLEWRFEDIVGDDRLVYAKYSFSYTSLLPGVRGRRVRFEGVSQFLVRTGLIARYWEVFDAGIPQSQLGFDAARIARFAARRSAALLATPGGGIR